MTVQSSGMMTAVESSAPTYAGVGSAIGAMSFTEQPKGSVIFKNLTSGASKTINLRDAVSDEIFWDAATDDPTGKVGDSFSIKASGSFPSLTVMGVGANPWISNMEIQGNGHAEYTGIIEAAGA